MKTPYKALIVDDERLARKEIISMLSDYENIVVAGEAEDAPSAINAIYNYKPDVIFLDIQMPGKSGFDLLNEINVDAKIIFVTAFDEYAIRAFEINALDYLLKPISPGRLQKAIGRLEQKNKSNNTSLRKLEYTDRLFLSIDAQMQFMKVSSILSISAAGDYSELLTMNGKKELTQKSMKEWESRLPENYFSRIHRSTIINMEFVERLEEWYNYSYRVYLKGVKNPYLISRRYVSKLKDKLG